MHLIKVRKFSWIFLFIIIFLFDIQKVQSQTGIGLSSFYPGDVNIENDPNVIFVEKFEEATLTELSNRWGDVRNQNNISFTTDIPPGSPAGGHAANFRSTIADSGSHLYKMLIPGIDDTLYVRYYIKYPLTDIPHHSGIWIGGYSPLSAWPDPQAGTKPIGNDRFLAGAEEVRGSNRFDHYDYWMGMHADGVGSYWGNFLLNNSNVTATLGEWTCVEEMVKLNNPVTALNGEHAIWLNGVKVSHLGQSFSNGSWGDIALGQNTGIFTQNSGVQSTFEGFQWRNNSSLNINWIWLQNYSDNLNSNLVFDHVVVAKQYIGCLQVSASPPAPIPPPAPPPSPTQSPTPTPPPSPTPNPLASQTLTPTPSLSTIQGDLTQVQKLSLIEQITAQLIILMKQLIILLIQQLQNARALVLGAWQAIAELFR